MKAKMLSGTGVTSYYGNARNKKKMKYQPSALTSDVNLFLSENLCCTLPEFQMTMYVVCQK